jgi:hypothetical protein
MRGGEVLDDHRLRSTDRAALREDIDRICRDEVVATDCIVARGDDLYYEWQSVPGSCQIGLAIGDEKSSDRRRPRTPHTAADSSNQ